MADTYVHTTDDGLTLALGYRHRPFDPRSMHYAWSANLPEAAPAVDLTKPVFFWGAGADKRWPCEDQSSMGSCAAFAGGNAAAEAYGMAGGTPTDLMKDWLYFKARQKESSYPADAGSDPADILDFCMSGAPPTSVEPGGYVPNPSASFEQYTPQASLKYVASFHPFYPNSGDFRSLVWQALAAGYPVVLAALWTNAFFSPINGILPQGQTPAQEIGGHAFRCYGYIPPFGPYAQGLFACRNNWTAGWGNAQASGLPNAQPGDFYVPCEYAQNGIIEAAWTVIGVGTQPTPPQPQPTPEAITVAISAPPTATAGQAVSMSANATGQRNAVVYQWVFADGQGAGGQAVSHAYAQPGNYSVNCYATDATTGVRGVASALVSVSTAPAPPASDCRTRALALVDADIRQLQALGPGYAVYLPAVQWVRQGLDAGLK